MKLSLVFFLAVISASAQTSPSPRLASACGPQNITFGSGSEPSSTAAVPSDSTKAMVVFIQDDGTGGVHQHYTVRIGLNGKRVGAYKQSSYFSLLVDPGDQHVCANVQSNSALGKIIALAHFEAEAGKVYYFRTRFIAGLPTIYPTYPILELDRPDSDEAKFLIESYPLTDMTPAH